MNRQFEGATGQTGQPVSLAELGSQAIRHYTFHSTLDISFEPKLGALLDKNYLPCFEKVLGALF
jgi:hypothetical protein